MDTNNPFLREVSKWKLEAAEEDSARYFYSVNGLDGLTDGSTSSVLGRKGSGKTAIAEHIRGMSDYSTVVINLSFKNFPFNEVYKFSDDRYTRPSQYMTFWKYVIYSAVCGKMAESASIDPDITSDLARHFRADIDSGLARSVQRVTDFGVGLEIAGVGGNLSGARARIENETPWVERVRILEDVVNRYIDDRVYYVVFDELDEDYKDVLDVDVSSKYFDLLIGLYKATHDLRRNMSAKAKVRPVVFLRDDIFDLMRDNDKNKWWDSALTLNWTEGSLQGLVGFRLSRALASRGDPLSFNEISQLFFASETTRAGGLRQHRPVFKHILSKTLMRPRDVISFLRECAKEALDGEEMKVSPRMLGAAESRYSARLRREFIDEIQAAVPYINDVFEVLAKQRKQLFSFREFGSKYDQFMRDRGDLEPVSFDHLCKILFHYSVIGNQPSQRNANIFKYKQPEAQLNTAEKAVLHPGLLKSLQIS